MTPRLRPSRPGFKEVKPPIKEGGEVDPELPRTPRLGRSFRASRIQRSWKLWYFRRAFERYSIDCVGFLASLNWLRKHNMLYGIELADPSDTKHWNAAHRTAPKDSEIDPWGHQRLREHLDRIWNIERDARRRVTQGRTEGQSSLVRNRSTPRRSRTAQSGPKVAQPVTLPPKAVLPPSQRHSHAERCLARSLPPPVNRGFGVQASGRIPVGGGFGHQAWRIPMPRLELGAPRLSFHPSGAVVPFLAGGPPPPVAGRIVGCGGPPPTAGGGIGGARISFHVVETGGVVFFPLSEASISLAGIGPMVAVAKNAPDLRIQPAWMQHDKQVLRYYAYFQEPVVESPMENFRIRKCTIFYYLEDGSLQISEPKVHNSGLQQGPFLKRHRVEHPDGGYFGPANLRCGITINVYGRKFMVTSCDKFTKDFYKDHGLNIGEERETPLDQYTAAKQKSVQLSQQPIPEAVREQKVYNEMILGGGRTNPKMKQYLENDRKVLRFYAYWDDKTRYGTRQYYTIHFFLVDDTLEILEIHTRNSGRDRYPTFYKRGPLLKKPIPVHTPGMFVDEMKTVYDETGGRMRYSPHDLSTNTTIAVYGREFFIYDCDSATREFYKKFNGNPQEAVELDVEPPTHYELTKPPHIGVGLEEDSLGSCYSLRPKPPRQDMVKKMMNSGKILRFEARMDNNQPEDANRRFIIGVYLLDDQVAVWEMRCRNSGQTEGKFSEKSRKRNPATGQWFSPSEFYVGATVTLAAVPFYIVRADEYTLKFMEAQGSSMGFHYSDLNTIAKKLVPLESCEDFTSRSRIDPDELNELVASCIGRRLVDHEIVTIIRSCGDLSKEPCEIDVSKVMEAVQRGRRLKTAKDFVDEEAGNIYVPIQYTGVSSTASSAGGDDTRADDLFAEEDPHQEAPNSEDELMDEIDATAEREQAASPPEPSAVASPARVEPAFCPGANTPQGVQATEGNNGINKVNLPHLAVQWTRLQILLCWNSHGVVTRQMLTPPDVQVPDDE
ncbi:EF-hand domain (C-terminal) containing, partial [Perkinsus olseni]